MLKIPTAFFDSNVVEEVSPALWANAFNEIGWPSSLIDKKDSFTHDDLNEALKNDQPSDEFLLMVEALHDLGTESGRDAIAVAMKDRKVSLDSLPANASDLELALHLFLAQRKDVALNGVFTRAQIQMQEGDRHRRYNEFTGKDARPLKQIEKKTSLLKVWLESHCAANNFGQHVQVDGFEDDGIVVFRIIRSHHTRKPLVIVPGVNGRIAFEHRPVHCDVVQYDSATGLLRLAVKASAMIQPYREAFGDLLFGDKKFFSGDPVCDLEILQSVGKRLLAEHYTYGVSRVRMTEVLWDRNDHELLTIRSQDCFETIERLNLDLGQGRLLKVKLKLDVIGKSTRPITVTIRAPSRIEISQTSQESVVNQFLTEIGIRNSKREHNDVSLLSLLPSRHSIDTWRKLFKTDADQLIASGALKKTQLSAVESPNHPGAGRVLEASQLQNGDFYGVSNMPEIPSQTLSATDIDGWEFVPEKFRAFLRSTLLTSGAGTTYGGNGLLDLGVMAIGDHRVRAFYGLKSDSVGLGPWIRSCAAGDLPIIFLPPSTTTAVTDTPSIQLENAIPDFAATMRQTVATLSLAVPANLIAPPNAQIILDKNLKKVWVKGVEIVGLVPDSQPYHFIAILAGANGAAVSSYEISLELSFGQKGDDIVTRQAKRDVNKHVREAFEKAGQPPPENFFPSAGKKMHRCILLPFIA